MITWNFCSFICWPFIFSFVMHSNDAEPSCPLIAHKLIRTETNRKIEVKWRKRNHSFYRYPCMNFSCIWARSKQLDFGTEIHMLFLSMIWPTKYKRFKCWLKRYAAIFFFFFLSTLFIFCVYRGNIYIRFAFNVFQFSSSYCVPSIMRIIDALLNGLSSTEQIVNNEPHYFCGFSIAMA